MTSEEIANTDLLAKSEKQWLKEIAYQLALLNEAKAEPEKRGPGRPKKQ